MMQKYSDRIVIQRCPLIGRLHFVWDIQGFIQMSIIIFYWAYNTAMTMNIVLIPNYHEGKISLVFIFIYCIVAINCILCLFKAATLNPGRVPLGTEVDMSDQKDWTFCQVCQRKRPSRAHHCRRCKQCVMRMDHHCPWINNCVGEANHYAFIQLLFYAMVLSSLSLLLGVLHFFVYKPCTQCDQSSWFMVHNYGVIISVIVMGVMMSCPMAAMLLGNHLNFLYDRTTLEAMKDPFPPNLQVIPKPVVEIYEDHCGDGPPWRWLLPCHYKRRSLPQYLSPYDV
ncbi:palmitoyltransferase ZDHHC21-like [Lineus longissimus]|uniref:palmitoyltransferase ZDHHC21-like n=1 Tax=Lineus longissimus TaxID=88925 RepID=UPI002B4F5396